MQEPTNKELLEAISELGEAMKLAFEKTWAGIGRVQGQVSSIETDVRSLRQDIIRDNVLQNQIDEIKEHVGMN